MHGADETLNDNIQQRSARQVARDRTRDCHHICFGDGASRSRDLNGRTESRRRGRLPELVQSPDKPIDRRG